MEGEDDERGEEVSSEGGVDEEWVEGVFEEGLAFVVATVAVGGVSACKNNISFSDFAFTWHVSSACNLIFILDTLFVPFSVVVHKTR